MNLPQTHGLFQKNRGLALALLILAAPFLVGGWEITMHKGINPSYVERIQDGKTKKSEILTLFGDPQETKRTSDGLIFVYKTYRTKEKSVSWKESKSEESKTAAAVDSPYSLDQTLKRKPKEGPTQEVSSALTIYFGSDSETVQSHDFKQY
jgi:hypothetical protein